MLLIYVLIYKIKILISSKNNYFYRNDQRCIYTWSLTKL